MYRKVWMGLLLMAITGGLLLTVSCTKRQQGMTQTGMTQDSAAAAEEQARLDAENRRLQEEELARQKAVEQARREEELRRQAQLRERFTNEDIYFEYDSAVLSPAAQEALKQKADWMRNNPNVAALIEGHCDERGSSEYNLALGDRRAESAKAYLVDLGISPSRLTTISYGEERPVDPGHSEAAWAKNRRAHFVIK